MAGDVFEQNGWNTFFLGANTPINDLIEFIKEVKPDVVAISVSLDYHFPVLEKMIQKITAQFPDLLILAGGQAFQHGLEKRLPDCKNVLHLPDLYQLDHFLKTMN